MEQFYAYVDVSHLPTVFSFTNDLENFVTRHLEALVTQTIKREFNATKLTLFFHKDQEATSFAICLFTKWKQIYVML